MEARPQVILKLSQTDDQGTPVAEVVLDLDEAHELAAALPRIAHHIEQNP